MLSSYEEVFLVVVESTPSLPVDSVVYKVLCYFPALLCLIHLFGLIERYFLNVFGYESTTI